MDVNRRTAYYTLMDVETKQSYSNIALNNHISSSKPDSPAFIRELVYGVLENKLYLDYIIDQLIKTSAEKMKASDLTVLRMGIYQIKFMDSVPEFAAVNESVNLAKRFCRGREGFINGVLRNYIRNEKDISLPDRSQDQVSYLSIKYSYDPSIIELWLSQYSADFVEELLAAGNATPELVIRVNTLKISRDDLKKKIAAKGYEAVDGLLCNEAIHVKGSGLLADEHYNNGLFSVQDESSMLAVNMLEPLPDQLVIDVCAAPGGKSLGIAEKMENHGQVIAWDVYKKKLAIVDKEAQRLGITIVKTNSWDATIIDSSMIGKADRVLVDAPCSGLGVLRRKPEIKYKKLIGEINALPKKQLAILSASSNYVKPGGFLVYSTCTISPYENQNVVNEFLKFNPSFVKEDAQQLLPNVNNTDGFYICKMRKKNNTYE